VGAALASGRPVILVCAGSWEEYSHEDALFAGAVCDRAGVDHPVRSVWRGRTQPLTAALAATLNGRHLARIGLGADVEECARVDVLDHVPRVCGGVLGWPGGCPNSS
jgi:2-phosphosulfolactate phosphatase